MHAFGRSLSGIVTMGALLLAGTVLSTPVAARENYALLVTASDYPNLAPKFWLKGPKNDEVLVRDYLLNAAPVPFLPANVVALGSGEGLKLATHQAILDQLAALARKTQPGDFVYLHFSGHGSQQPAQVDASEPDGRDEIFLSADTQMAPKDNPTFMPNVLTDNEIGAALTAIRKTGAFVWVVFDNCHSGTVTRGAPDGEDVAERRIDPADLGIPESAFATPEADEATSRAAPLAAGATEAGDEAGMGGMVAFFAAQSTETTPERGFDVTQPDGSVAKVPYGVFTYRIFEALAKNPGATYRQIAQSVLAAYTAENLLKPTPLFEGQLDRPVFGSTDAVAAAQWPTVVGGKGELSISAGQLHGLAVGSKLLVLPSPAAGNADALGVVAVTAVTQLRATLGPSSDASHKELALADIPRGAYVRLAETTFPFELTVAKPDPATTDPAQLALIDAALSQIDAASDKQLRLKVVAPGDSADVRLAVLSDQLVASRSLENAEAPGDDEKRLWLLPSDGVASVTPERRSPTLDIPAEDAAGFAQTLQERLTTIFRATSLAQLTGASTYKPKDFTLSFAVQTAGATAVTPLVLEETPIVHQGDRLYVDFKNSSGKPADLNVLYIDRDYGITLICQTHLANNDRVFAPMADLTETDLGPERLVAVINESGKDITDLSFLQQPGLPVATRSAEQDGLMGMLADLGAGLPTRGPNPVATADGKTPRGAVVLAPLEVRAGTGAEAAANLAIETPITGSCTP